jgi:acetyl esterase/lipase
LDYARAVRYVRANAEKYGVDEDKIAGAVFSMVEL